MNDYTLTLRPARTLDRYGAASRCLLRLWENAGNLSPPEDEFLRRFETRFPHWTAHPGELDAPALGVVAREFGLAEEIVATRDYHAVLLAHRFGREVILRTERAPLQHEQGAELRPHFLLLEQIDEDGFVAWCPFESGASDLLPRAGRQWWHRWKTEAFVLHTGPVRFGV